MPEHENATRSPVAAFERRSVPRPATRSRPHLGSAGISDGPSRAVIARRDRIYRRALVAADGVAALIAIALAVQIVGNDELHLTAFLAAPIAVMVGKVIGLYDRDELVLTKSTLDESPQLFQLAALYALLITVLQEQLMDGRLGAKQILGLWLLLFAGAFVGRFVARGIAGLMTPPERCLVIGDLRSTGAIGAKLDRESARHQTLAARLPLDFDEERSEVLLTIREAVTTHDAHRVILAPQVADTDAVLDAIRLVKSMGVKVSLLPRLFEVVGTSVVFDDLDGVTVLGVRRFGLSRSSAALKRLMDLSFAVAGILVVAPALAIIAVAVRFDSPGPLLFRQIRVGRDGKRFEMLKFRSMVVDADDIKLELKAETGQEGMFKLIDDPRITRVGRLLRATSLDELPQLFNVLRGDMSLVGPRPLVVDEDALVQGWHRRRLHLVPGMTGPWQVLGSTRVPLQEMVKIDYLYIANWSMWRDVKILLRTVAHVMHRSGL
jgi:exopolysaccharide biosynthesis polyprenyl glycosylphosphotransferase